MSLRQRLAAACGVLLTAAALAAQVTVVDDRGHRVTLTKPPLRVVSLSPSPPAIAGDHGRSAPLGLTASTTNPPRLRRSASAPCRRKRS